MSNVVDGNVQTPESQQVSKPVNKVEMTNDTAQKMQYRQNKNLL